MHEELLTDGHVRLFATEFNRDVERPQREGRSQHDEERARLAVLEAEIGNLAANIFSGVSPTAARAAAPGVEKALRGACRGAAEEPLGPGKPPGGGEVIGELIGEVVIHPAEKTSGEPEAEVTASVAKLTELAGAKSRPQGEVGCSVVR